MRDSGRVVGEALELLRPAYGDLAALLPDLDGDETVGPTGCAVLDLAQHLVLDGRRGLVACWAATCRSTGTTPRRPRRGTGA